MAKISGEAILNPSNLKWGYIIYSEDGEVYIEPEYKFNNQNEAEQELVYFLLKAKEESNKYEQ